MRNSFDVDLSGIENDLHAVNNAQPDDGVDLSALDDEWGDEPAEKNDSWQITKGVKAGVDQLQGIGGGVIAIAGDLVGSDNMRDYGMDMYERNKEEAAVNEGNISTYKDVWVEGDMVTSLNNAADYALHGVGTVIPMFAPSLLGGGVGAVVAKRAATKLIASQAAKYAAKGMASKQALNMATQAVV